MIVVEFYGGENILFESHEEWENSGWAHQPFHTIHDVKKYHSHDFFKRYKVKIQYEKEGDDIEIATEVQSFHVSQRRRLEEEGFLDNGLYYAGAAFGYGYSWPEALQHALSVLS